MKKVSETKNITSKVEVEKFESFEILSEGLGKLYGGQSQDQDALKPGSGCENHDPTTCDNAS